jgi:hypothetical protein
MENAGGRVLKFGKYYHSPPAFCVTHLPIGCCDTEKSSSFWNRITIALFSDDPFPTLMT